MKNLITLLLLTLSFVCNSQLNFKGDIITDGPIEMVLETCSDRWETTSQIQIPFYNSGIFGSKNNFNIRNFECGEKYRLVIKTNENERKVLFIDLSNMKEQFTLKASVDPKMPNVMISWGKHGITYAHCIND